MEVDRRANQMDTRYATFESQIQAAERKQDQALASSP